MIQSISLFLLAGLAEIGGGYLVWLWIREGTSIGYGVIGSLILVLYGVIPTLQNFPSFGRVYAAYGGIFVILSILWGWGIDQKVPDRDDWLGALFCMAGVIIMLWAPRNG